MKRLLLTGVLTLSMLFGMFGDLPVAKVCTQASGDSCTAIRTTCQLLEADYYFFLFYCANSGGNDWMSCWSAELLYREVGQCWNDYDQSCNYNGI